MCCRRGEGPSSAWSLLTWEVGSHALCDLLAPASLVGTPGGSSLCSCLSGCPAFPQVAGPLPPAHEASLREAGPDQGRAGSRLVPAPATVSWGLRLQRLSLARLSPQSCLEFSLRVQEFIELVRQNKRLDAVRCALRVGGQGGSLGLPPLCLGPSSGRGPRLLTGKCCELHSPGVS